MIGPSGPPRLSEQATQAESRYLFNYIFIIINCKQIVPCAAHARQPQIRSLGPGMGPGGPHPVPGGPRRGPHGSALTLQLLDRCATRPTRTARRPAPPRQRRLASDRARRRSPGAGGWLGRSTAGAAPRPSGDRGRGGSGT